MCMYTVYAPYTWTMPGSAGLLSDPREVGGLLRALVPRIASFFGNGLASSSNRFSLEVLSKIRFLKRCRSDYNPVKKP